MGRVFGRGTTKWWRFKEWAKDLGSHITALPGYLNPPPLRPTPLTEEEKQMAADILNESEASYWYEFITTIGYTDEELSDKLGVSLDLVKRWRRGESEPHPLACAKIIDFLVPEHIRLKGSDSDNR